MKISWAMLIGCLVMFSAQPIFAAEKDSEYKVTTQELTVDKENGTYSFDICIDSPENYAGAEFGIICSQGVEVTAVECNAGNTTGPKKSNGLVWFGFFEGEDSFEGKEVITVEGSFESGTESVIVIQDIKIYTVGDEEYKSTPLEGGIVVSLYTNSVENVNEDTVNESGIDTMILLVCFMVIVAIVVSVLIYKKKIKGEKSNE